MPLITQISKILGVAIYTPINIQWEQWRAIEREAFKECLEFYPYQHFINQLGSCLLKFYNEEVVS